jgi:hypothetical protein
MQAYIWDGEPVARGELVYRFGHDYVDDSVARHPDWILEILRCDSCGLFDYPYGYDIDNEPAYAGELDAVGANGDVAPVQVTGTGDGTVIMLDLCGDCQRFYALGRIDFEEGVYLPVTVERVRGTVKRDSHGTIIDVVAVPPFGSGLPF